MAQIIGGRWTDLGGTASGSYTDVLRGSGGVVAWSIVGAGWGNQTTLPTPDGFKGTIDLAKFLPQDYEEILRNAFNIWSEVADIAFIQVADAGGDLGASSYPTIRIAGGYLDGKGKAWGLGSYPSEDPQGGDIFFDSSDKLDRYQLLWLSLHEIGHSLGLGHSSISNAVMYPYYNYSRNLRNDDIEGITSIYGEQDGQPNDYFMPAALQDVEVLSSSPLLVVHGNDLDNRIVGTIGSETFVGGQGNDVFIGGFGHDTFDGGDGIDTVEYSHLSRNVEISLSEDRPAWMDSLFSIENLKLDVPVATVHMSSDFVDNMIEARAGGSDKVYLPYEYDSGYAVAGSPSRLVISGFAGTDTFVGIDRFIFTDGTNVDGDTLMRPPEPGTISITEVISEVVEGNESSFWTEFKVERTGGTANVSVDFRTEDGTATLADGDYTPVSGTLHFRGAINTRSIRVYANPDTKIEEDETFFVKLSNATAGATIVDQTGSGVILSDERPTPRVRVIWESVTIHDGTLVASKYLGTDFELVARSANLVRTFTVENTGTGALRLSDLVVPSGFVLIDGLPSEIPAGSYDAFQLRIDTSVLGYKSGQVSFATNDPLTSTFNFAIGGGVIEPPPLIVNGTDDNDTFQASTRSETFAGGAGIDTVSYADAGASVISSLGNPKKNAGFAAGDGYTSIENLVGSDHDDTLTGSAEYNILEGGKGADKLDGGKGIDAASYANAESGVTADLSRSKSNIGEAAGDTYKNIQNLIGSAFEDRLVGDDKDNAIDGGAGNDILIGNGGSDTLTGGLGSDTFVFNRTNDGGKTGDVIRDFVSGDDLFEISKSGFKIFAGLDLNDFTTDYFVSNASGVDVTATGHGQFVFDESTSQLWWDADGAGRKAAVLLATFENNAQLLATDFDLL